MSLDTKNSKQNFSKSNPMMYLKIIHDNQVEFIPDVQAWFNM